MARQSKADARQNGCLDAIGAACDDFVLAFNTLFDPTGPNDIICAAPDRSGTPSTARLAPIAVAILRAKTAQLPPPT
jgi:hypothetical protein